MFRFRGPSSTWRNLRWMARASGLRRDLTQLRSRLQYLDGRIRQLERKIDRWQRHDQTRAWVYGHQMCLNPDDTVVSARLYRSGCFEPFETELIQHTIQRGDVAVDIGANIGYYTLHFARLVGPEGHVFAFEPDPDNFELLRRNVRQNGYQNVTLIQKAVSSHGGTTRLYRNDKNHGDHRIYPSDPARDSILVDTVTLDEYFAGSERKIRFIKMDIQGAEGLALRGMTGVLNQKTRLRLVTEFWPRGLQLAGSDPHEFLQALLNHGFHIQVIDERSERLNPLDIPALLDRLPTNRETDIHFTNLYCQRRA